MEAAGTNPLSDSLGTPSIANTSGCWCLVLCTEQLDHILIILTHIHCNQLELFQSALQVFNDVTQDYARFWKVGRVLQAFVFEPEDVQAGLITADDFIKGVGTPAAAWCALAPGGGALEAVRRVVQGDELGQISSLERVGLQGEVHVGAQVVDPELLGPGGLAGRLLVEEDHVRLYPLSVEEPGGKAQERVHVAFKEELLPDRLPCPTLEEDVVRDNHGGPAVLLEEGLDVLDKVQLLVGGGGPEVLPLDDVLLHVDLAVLADDGGGALLAEGRVGEDQVEPLPRIGCQGIGNGERQLLAANAVEHQVHGAEARRIVHQLPPAQGLAVQELLLLPVQLVVFCHVFVGRKQEASGTTGRVADRLPRLRRHDVHHGLDQRTRREVLPCPALGILGVLLKEPLVGVPLHVGAHDRPVFLVQEVHQQAAQLGRVLELVLRPPEDQPQEPLLLPQLLQGVAVVVEEVVPVLLQEARPVVADWYGALLVEGLLRPLVGHLEEEEKGELLDIVAVAHPVVPEDVAEVPEFLDDCRRGHSGYQK